VATAKWIHHQPCRTAPPCYLAHSSQPHLPMVAHHPVTLRHQYVTAQGTCSKDMTD
jgi:hypothetical protein